MRQDGMFGHFGGHGVPELLIPALEELEEAWLEARQDPAFASELGRLLSDYAGRPTPLYRSTALSEAVGCHVWLKREDLLHGGAHKTNNTLAQALLACRRSKRRLIAETGAGQHGVAAAMAGALFDLPVRIFMGAKGIARQRPNVGRMELLGAEVVPVEVGSRSLKDAINETLRFGAEQVVESFYVFGTAAGPHPYPSLLRDFQRVIGDEIKDQLAARHGRLPTAVIVAVGGGSNAIGAFAAFLEDEVELIGVEPAGTGLDGGRHGAPLSRGRVGCVHGSLSYLLQDAPGPGPRGPQHLGRSGLPRRRTSAGPPARHRPRPLPRGDGPGGPGRLRVALPPRGVPAGPGVQPRPHRRHRRDPPGPQRGPLGRPAGPAAAGLRRAGRGDPADRPGARPVPGAATVGGAGRQGFSGAA